MRWGRRTVDEARRKWVMVEWTRGAATVSVIRWSCSWMRNNITISNENTYQRFSDWARKRMREIKTTKERQENCRQAKANIGGRKGKWILNKGEYWQTRYSMIGPKFEKCIKYHILTHKWHLKFVEVSFYLYISLECTQIA